MPVVLTVVGESANSPAQDWDAFLLRRADLTRRMHLSICDGCDHCGLRCMDGFTVSREEWEAVKDYLAQSSPDDVKRIAHQPKTVPWPGAEETGATVTFCRFRDNENGRCSIYPVRPTICRLFGQVSWLPCPIEAIPEYPEDAGDVWNQYRRFHRKTFAEWEAADAAPQLSSEKNLQENLSHTEGNQESGSE